MKVKPYYQDDSCTIYHGDCRDILPHLEPVDLVLTDPPYGIKANVKTQSTGRGRVDHTKKFDGRYSQDWPEVKGDDF